MSIVELQPLRLAYHKPVRLKLKFTENTVDVYDGSILITAFFPKGGSVIEQAWMDQFRLPRPHISLPRS